MSKEDLVEIVKVLKDRDIVIISDEIYSDYTYNHEHYSLSSFPEIRDRVIVINGFSKTYAMTGWRLGYAWGNKDLIAAMCRLHQYATICASTISQYAALEAMKHDYDNVNKVVDKYRERGNLICKGLNNIGLKCLEPEGAFYVFPSIESTGMSSVEFCEQLLLQERVALVPGTAFGECGEGYVRACYAMSSMENITEALKRINRFVEKNGKKYSL
ncbi:MAG: putative N-acetyl-LL-diaminopimelate aminotransferase [Firmicutes bacterium ADurb.Bin419]|nr:MAG: putative N-acetyl-LL-diaminopimelate aminotransferase [Firmicutes bacterium ADurb.Bin419]